MKNTRTYYIYMFTNWNNKVLYIGVTNDLRRRVYEHKNKLIKGFTEKYNLTKLVYFEEITITDTTTTTQTIVNPSLHLIILFAISWILIRRRK